MVYSVWFVGGIKVELVDRDSANSSAFSLEGVVIEPSFAVSRSCR